MPRTFPCCSQSPRRGQNVPHRPLLGVWKPAPSRRSQSACLLDFDRQTLLIPCFLLFPDMMKGMFALRQQETVAYPPPGFQSRNISAPGKWLPAVLPPAASIAHNIVSLRLASPPTGDAVFSKLSANLRGGLEVGTRLEALDLFLTPSLATRGCCNR